MPRGRHFLWLLFVLLLATPSFASVSPQPQQATTQPAPPEPRTASVTPTFEVAPSNATPLALQQSSPSSSVVPILLGLAGAWVLFLGLGLVRRR